MKPEGWLELADRMRYLHGRRILGVTKEEGDNIVAALRLAAKPADEGVREADGSTDEKALVLIMNVLQRIADTALAGFKEDGIDESSALSSINNIARAAIDTLAK